MSPMLAMPTTTVENTIGAMSIRIALMKASPSGCRRSPVCGAKCPSSTPPIIPATTWTHSCAYQRRPVAEIGACATLTATLMIEPEQPCRIVNEEQPAMLIVRCIQCHEVHQVAVVRHIGDVRVWPVGSPQHASWSGLDERPGEWNGIVKRRTGAGNSFGSRDLHPALFVALDERQQRLECGLLETGGPVHDTHVIDHVRNRQRLEARSEFIDRRGLQIEIDMPAQRRDAPHNPIKGGHVGPSSESRQKCEAAAVHPSGVKDFQF